MILNVFEGTGSMSTRKCLCRCDCGYEATKLFKILKYGRSTKCVSCHLKQLQEKHIKYRLQNGQRFGKWTIMEKKIINRSTVYVCKCECGIIRNLTGNRLVVDQTTSCGKCKKKNTTLRNIARLQKSLIA